MSSDSGLHGDGSPKAGGGTTELDTSNKLFPTEGGLGIGLGKLSILFDVGIPRGLLILIGDGGVGEYSGKMKTSDSPLVTSVGGGEVCGSGGGIKSSMGGMLNPSGGATATNELGRFSSELIGGGRSKSKLSMDKSGFGRSFCSDIMDEACFFCRRGEAGLQLVVPPRLLGVESSFFGFGFTTGGGGFLTGLRYALKGDEGSTSLPLSVSSASAFKFRAFTHGSFGEFLGE